jgi:hypothetical protein
MTSPPLLAAKSFPRALEGAGFIEVQIQYFGKRT